MGSVSAEISRQTIVVYWPARVANGQAAPIRLSGYGAKRPKAMTDYMFRHDISFPGECVNTSPSIVSGTSLTASGQNYAGQLFSN